MRDMGLFRGKRIGNGEWIEGWYFQKQNPYAENGLPIEHCISDLPPFGAGVDPETVGECTYLKDTTGKLIFEGDILSGHFDDEYPDDETRVIVEWNDMGWTIRQTDRPETGYDVLDPYDGLWTVIGNIYDNPELMRGGE